MIFAECAHHAVEVASAHHPEHALLAIFGKFDRHGAGEIPIDAACRALAALGQPMRQPLLAILIEFLSPYQPARSCHSSNSFAWHS